MAKRKPHVGPWSVYVLRDPRDNTVRYVGATTSHPEKRLRQHLTQRSSAGSPAKIAWIDELSSAGLLCILEVVESVTNEAHSRSAALERESAWIEKMLAAGANLLNARNCGAALLPTGHPGRRLRELIRSRRMSEVAAATALHTTCGSIGRWADGAARPHVRRRAQIEAWSDGEIKAPEWDRFPLVVRVRTGRNRRGAIPPVAERRAAAVAA